MVCTELKKQIHELYEILRQSPLFEKAAQFEKAIPDSKLIKMALSSDDLKGVCRHLAYFDIDLKTWINQLYDGSTPIHDCITSDSSQILHFFVYSCPNDIDWAITSKTGNNYLHCICRYMRNMDTAAWLINEVIPPKIMYQLVRQTDSVCTHPNVIRLISE